MANNAASGEALSRDLKVFRTDTRKWIGDNFPPSLERLGPLHNPTEATVRHESDDYRRWVRAMGEKGWGVPSWPIEYDGGGLNTEQTEIVLEELARVGAFNPIAGLGVMILGPTLLEFGTEEQKRRHLPPIARGECRWCQGFSEPGAGSDLASLQTRCEDFGDHWLVNGQKLWTSFAHIADWCFCLVRTDTSRKQGGITFLLINMRTDGVQARPIKLINGASHFCELFLNDVKVQKSETVGEINGGWTVAKHLLQHERNSLSKERKANLDLVPLAREYVGVDSAGRLADPDMRQRLIDHLITNLAFEHTMRRRAVLLDCGQTDAIAVSSLKNIGARVAQERSDLAVEILGHRSLGWSGSDYRDEEIGIVRAWLYSKAFSIYGGSHEVQNNITAKQVLNLPT
jgi:acyl-CoA dehydrogenase